jgi:3-oxoacyl-[acyl-carrier protein] reductase
MRFPGRKVVITGAAGVYGRELAAAFAAEGASLLLADRSEADLAAAVPAGLAPDRVALHAADLAADAGIDGLVAAATAAGAPDVLVNKPASIRSFR